MVRTSLNNREAMFDVMCSPQIWMCVILYFAVMDLPGTVLVLYLGP